MQNDLNSVYEWASDNNMFFNAQKFQYICSSLDIIDYYRHVLDLGIYVSIDCSSNFILLTLIKDTFNWLDTANFLLLRQIDNVDLI